MPKSKRDQRVSLTKVDKRTSLFNKQILASAVRTAFHAHNFVYVFSIQNMRNAKLKVLRNDWNDSRFFMGKSKVMKFGLGMCAETEESANVCELVKSMDTQTGLLFTNRPVSHVTEWFDRYKEAEFARAGAIASKTVTLAAGPLEKFSFSMENHLRSLGLPTRLDRSIVTLTTDFEVCRRGEVLRPDQTKILKLLGIKLSVFRVHLKCWWCKSSGEVTYSTAKADEEDLDIVHRMDESEPPAAAADSPAPASPDSTASDVGQVYRGVGTSGEGDHGNGSGDGSGGSDSY